MKMKTIKILIIGLLLLTSITCVSAFKKNEELNLCAYSSELLKAIPYAQVYVDDDNTEGPWDGTYKHPYQHIQDGINAAQEGDIVFVFNGTYNGNKIIEKPVILKGDRQKSIITGENIFINNTNNVSISGFSIKHLTTYGLCVKQSSNCKINDNYFYDCFSGGIYIDNSSGNTICFNTIDGVLNICCRNWNGIVLIYGSTNNNVYKNNINNTYVKGIWLKDVSNNVISNNVIKNIKGAKWAFSYHDFGIHLYNSSCNIVKENFIENDKGSAVNIDPGSDTNIFYGNTFIKCERAIEMDISKDNVFFENNITDNNYGYFCNRSLIFPAKNNTFYHNTFSNNNISVFDKSIRNNWYNPTLKEGNYWGDYKSRYPNARPKLLRPCIWNTPYSLVPHSLLNKDKYPLVNPFTK